MFEPVDDRQVAVHEIGHALILLSCGVDEFVELTHVELTPSHARRHGMAGVIVDGFETAIEGLYFPLDLDATASMAMTYAGGAAAEQTLGYELYDHGLASDITNMDILLCFLSGGSCKEIAFTRELYTAPISKHETALLEAHKYACEVLSETAKIRCGRSLQDLRTWLIQESRMRLSCCELAIDRLSTALIERGRLDVDEIHRVLRRTPWCGVTGSPVATSFFKDTWPSDFLFETIERAKAEG